MNEVGDGEMTAGFRIKYNDWLCVAYSQLGGRLNLVAWTCGHDLD